MEQKRYMDLMDKVKDFLQSEASEKVLTAIFSFITGLLASRGLTFGRYAPFGIAVTAAVPMQGLWYSVLGAAMGYLIKSQVYVPARYIASCVAVAAIRWSLSELKSINTHPLYAPVVSFLPLLATGMAMVFINRSQPATAALYLSEAFLAAGCAYFLSRTALLLTDKRNKTNFDTADVASFTVSMGIMILSFSNVSLAGISVGRVMTVLLVMYCANCGGISGGAVAGVAVGVIQGLSTAGLSYMSGAYGLGGLMAGVFSSMGKLAAAIAFIISHGVASLQVGDSSTMTVGAIEVGIAAVIYMFIPRNRRIMEIFGDRRDKLSGDSLRNNVITRLNFAADALSHVSDSVAEISKRLTVTPGINTVMNAAAGEVCSSCSSCAVCWKKEKPQTNHSFNELIKVIKENGKVEKDDFPEQITDRCRRVALLRDSINKHYRDHVAAKDAEVKTARLRAVTGEQFSTTSGLLRDIAAEFLDYQHIDEEASERIEEIFVHNNIYPVEVCCRIDKFGRMTVEAEIPKSKQGKINRSYFTREVGKACGRNFAQPCISVTDDTCRLVMCQKPNMDVNFGYYQHSAGDSKYCGDSVTGFYDGQGHYIAIISDGMGTGGKAAVDGIMTSSMAETLLKSGLGYDTSLKLINSALMTKSGDETLATLDISSVDLFTGHAEFRKAGAVGTFIRRGNRVDYVEQVSLPVGIMSDIHFSSFDENLRENDLVVMVSDGVTASGVDRIKELISGFEEDDPEYLSRLIVAEAVKHRTDGHDDDVTALAIMVV